MAADGTLPPAILPAAAPGGKSISVAPVFRPRSAHRLRACRRKARLHSPAMLRRVRMTLAVALAVAGAMITGAGEAPLADYARVEVAPTKTSIYLGVVSMTMPAFARDHGTYESTYVAKVFPFFFYNETGRLRVDISDDALRKLERGEAIEFKGRAVRTDGAERRVEGKATPIDGKSGKLKVRVFYSKRIELIFNTTYRFPDAWRRR
jgi:hypothetical protein